jgi:peptidyl-prolyl cis-trans isomerase B (cyclophilin B)
MILASLCCAALASCSAGQDSPPPPITVPAAEVQETTIVLEAPKYHVAGESMPVTVTITANVAQEIPSWALGWNAFSVDGKDLGKRQRGTLAMSAGQSISTTIDIGSHLPADAKDTIELSYDALTGASQTITMFKRAAKDIDFMSCDAGELSRFQVLMRTNRGDIWIDFYPDVAPNHVRNFLDLSQTGFYDGSGFHRVIQGFMIQGGQHGEGKPAPRSVQAEFSKMKHDRGILSAARLGNDIHSASSEFFLMQQANPGLDGKYSIYGIALDGLDIVDKIVATGDPRYSPQTPAGFTPTTPQIIEFAAVVHAVREDK